MSYMYDFIEKEGCTKNPLGGECYNCIYCYIHGKRGMKNWLPHLKNKYSGEFRLYEKVFKEKFPKNKNICFFCDTIDWLHKNVSIDLIYRIIEWIEKNENILFLSLTKNPIRYFDILDILPDNIIIGCTIESNINYPQYSKAPSNLDRIKAMIEIRDNDYFSYHQRFISIEPILKFNYELFNEHLLQINPTFGIAIGYDNHRYRLDEPCLNDTLFLRARLRSYGFRIFNKTIRKAWWEK